MRYLLPIILHARSHKIAWTIILTANSIFFLAVTFISHSFWTRTKTVIQRETTPWHEQLHLIKAELQWWKTKMSYHVTSVQFLCSRTKFSRWHLIFCFRRMLQLCKISDSLVHTEHNKNTEKLWSKTRRVKTQQLNASHGMKSYLK